jgi:hypothetical protein
MVIAKNKARVFPGTLAFEFRSFADLGGVTDEPAFHNSRFERALGNIRCIVKNSKNNSKSFTSGGSARKEMGD